MSEIPLNARAYVMVSYNHDFIKSLKDISPDTEKVYYLGIALKTPGWLNPSDVAERLAGEVDFAGTMERLELNIVHNFTRDLENAMRFNHDEIKGEVEELQFQIRSKIRSECLDEEYLPF